MSTQPQPSSKQSQHQQPPSPERGVESAIEDAAQARIRELEEQLAESRRQQELTQPPRPAPGTSGYEDSDRVTVLHAWGKVREGEVKSMTSPSKALYRFKGGVARNVLYADAKYWRDLFGKDSIKILPNDADEADFARATGIQPMNLGKLAAMNEAVDLDALLEAWGPERALRFAEKLTARIAGKSPANASNAPERGKVALG